MQQKIFDIQIYGIQLNGFRPKHVFKLLIESTGDKKTEFVSFVLVHRNYLEQQMLYVFEILYKTKFGKLIKDSMFKKVDIDKKKM